MAKVAGLQKVCYFRRTFHYVGARVLMKFTPKTQVTPKTQRKFVDIRIVLTDGEDNSSKVDYTEAIALMDHQDIFGVMTFNGDTNFFAGTNDN